MHKKKYRFKDCSRLSTGRVYVFMSKNFTTWDTVLFEEIAFIDRVHYMYICENTYSLRMARGDSGDGGNASGGGWDWVLV